MQPWIVAALALTACPRSHPEPAMATTSVRVVSSGADITGVRAARATITGTVERREGGTAIVLEDGTPIWVSDGEPPAGWDWLVGSQVRVQGELWDEGGRAILKDPEPPMPADGAMLLSPR